VRSGKVEHKRSNTMEAKRKRALKLLEDAGAPDAVALVHAVVGRAGAEPSDFAKAVRRVIAAVRRADVALPCDEVGLHAFVEEALKQQVATASEKKRPRQPAAVSAASAGGVPQRLTPPMPDDHKKLALLIPNVMTAAESQSLVERAELRGFRQATLALAGGGAVSRPDIRDNETVMFDDAAVATRIWELVRSHLPSCTPDGRRALGLDARLRLYRYTEGQSFSKHQDGATVRDGAQSLWTLLLYLNEDFEGGATRLCVFDDREVSRSLDVQPATGACFVFDHGILHSSTPITRGVKYVCRSDVMFSCSSGLPAAIHNCQKVRGVQGPGRTAEDLYL